MTRPGSRRVRLVGVVLVAAAWLALGWAGARPAAAAGDVGAYRASVFEALTILRTRPATSATAADAALALRRGTGDTQPEILQDLELSPPAISDATQRLAALDGALQRPADTADRADADRKLTAILSQARYAEAGPNLVQQAIDYLLRQLARLLSAATGGSPLLALVEIGVAVGVALLVLGLLLRILLSPRGAGEAATDRRRAPERARHAFAEADRLAAAGDYPGALRALTSAVATALGGIGTWETSPETVRELFRREGLLDALQPLLLPFEAAAYGRREPDAATYQGAARAAAPFRVPAEARERAA